MLDGSTEYGLTVGWEDNDESWVDFPAGRTRIPLDDPPIPDSVRREAEAYAEQMCRR